MGQSRTVPLVGSPILALSLSLPLGAVPGPSVEPLALSLRLCGSLFVMKCLLPHPVLLLAKCGHFPLLEGFRRFVVDAGICECLGESMGEVSEEEGIV